jgi:hypothetical protein
MTKDITKIALVTGSSWGLGKNTDFSEGVVLNREQGTAPFALLGETPRPQWLENRKTGLARDLDLSQSHSPLKASNRGGQGISSSVPRSPFPLPSEAFTSVNLSNLNQLQ